MVDIIRAGYDALIRAPTKTITFTGASGLGLAGTVVPVWTLSGRVLVHHLMCFCTTTVVSTLNGGNISLGTAANVTAFISETLMGSGTLAANDWWPGAGGTPVGATSDILATAATSPSTVSGSIIINPTTQDITSGVLVFDCFYRPLTSGASLT